MKVLFLIRWFPHYGGVERISALLANELAHRGWQPYIYAAKGNANADTFPLDPRVIVKIEGDNLDAGAAASYIAEQKINVVVNQVPYITVMPVIEEIKRIAGVRVVSVIHNDPRSLYNVGIPLRDNSTPTSYIIKKMTWPLYKIWNTRRVHRINDFYIQMSDKMLMLSQSYVPVYGNLHNMTQEEVESKVLAIPNFLPDESYVSADDRNTLLDGKEKEIVYVGRVTEAQKRISRLIKIWEKFSPSHPDWKLTIVGDGFSMSTNKKYVEKNGIDHISFEGFQDDVRRYYRRASIFVLVSEHEGFPMSQIEAMREGCVSVCYNSYLALDDMVTNGVEGYNIPHEDKAAFIRALNHLTEDPQLLRKMQNAAMDKAAKYCASEVVPMWEELFKSLAQKKD